MNSFDYKLTYVHELGEPGCDSSSSPTWEDLHDEQARQSLDNADKFGRITLNCETTVGGGNGGNNGFVTIIDLAVGLFFLILVAIGIWFCCVRRQKVMNAAIVQSYPGNMMQHYNSNQTKQINSITISLANQLD